MDFIFWERDRKKLFNPCPHGAYNLEVGKDKDTGNHNPSQKNKITERKVQSAMGGSMETKVLSGWKVENALHGRWHWRWSWKEERDGGDEERHLPHTV